MPPLAGSGRGTPSTSHSSDRNGWALARSAIAVPSQRAMNVSTRAGSGAVGTERSAARAGVGVSPLSNAGAHPSLTLAEQALCRMMRDRVGGEPTEDAGTWAAGFWRGKRARDTVDVSQVELALWTMNRRQLRAYEAFYTRFMLYNECCKPNQSNKSYEANNVPNYMVLIARDGSNSCLEITKLPNCFCIECFPLHFSGLFLNHFLCHTKQNIVCFVAKIMQNRVIESIAVVFYLLFGRSSATILLK